MNLRWLCGFFILATVSGCSLAPPPPTTSPAPIPAAPSPSGGPSPTATTDSPVVARGFSAPEQAALRVRNVGCGGLKVGSGFAISDHTLVTNRHVVGGAALLEVSGFDGRDISVTSAGAAIVADLALVKTVEALPATIRLADTNPTVGSPVTAIGFPLGGPLTTTRGHVTGYGRDPVGWSTLPMLMNDAAIQHGSSGGPLLDDAGDLVGIVYASTGPGHDFAVPVQVLRRLMADSSSLTTARNCDGAPPGQQ